MELPLFKWNLYPHPSEICICGLSQKELTNYQLDLFLLFIQHLKRTCDRRPIKNRTMINYPI